MTFWFAIVLIVALACVTGIVIQRYEVMGKLGSAEGQERRKQLETERDEAQRELAELRDRVKVLERLATDIHRPSQLADEIDSLRSEQEK